MVKYKYDGCCIRLSLWRRSLAECPRNSSAVRLGRLAHRSVLMVTATS
jgi:hypothetical protein